MGEAKPAQFQFEDYRIVKSIFEVREGEISDNLSIDVATSGRHFAKEYRYNLLMEITVRDENSNLLIKVVLEGKFTFDPDCDTAELEGFFYRNAPAIMFPYVRAYISALSTLGGAIRPVILPTLNLSSIYEELKGNTEVME